MKNIKTIFKLIRNLFLSTFVLICVFINIASADINILQVDENNINNNKAFKITSESIKTLSAADAKKVFKPLLCDINRAKSSSRIFFKKLDCYVPERNFPLLRRVVLELNPQQVAAILPGIDDGDQQDQPRDPGDQPGDQPVPQLEFVIDPAIDIGQLDLQARDDGDQPGDGPRGMPGNPPRDQPGEVTIEEQDEILNGAFPDPTKQTNNDNTTTVTNNDTTTNTKTIKEEGGNGLSAYEQYKDIPGNGGKTVKDFLTSLKGDQPGDNITTVTNNNTTTKTKTIIDNSEILIKKESLTFNVGKILLAPNKNNNKYKFLSVGNLEKQINVKEVLNLINKFIGEGVLKNGKIFNDTYFSNVTNKDKPTIVIIVTDSSFINEGSLPKFQIVIKNNNNDHNLGTKIAFEGTMFEPPEDDWFKDNFAQLEFTRNITIDKEKEIIEKKIDIAEVEVQELVETKIKLADDQAKELVIAEQKIKLAEKPEKKLELTEIKNELIKKQDQELVLVEQKIKLADDQAKELVIQRKGKQGFKINKDGNKIEFGLEFPDNYNSSSRSRRSAVGELVDGKLIVSYRELFNFAEQESQQNLQNSKNLLKDMFSDYSRKIKQTDAIKDFLNGTEVKPPYYLDDNKVARFSKEVYLESLMKYFKKILVDNKNKPLTTEDYQALVLEFSSLYFKKVKKDYTVLSSDLYDSIPKMNDKELLQLILDTGKNTGFNANYQIIGNIEKNLLATLIKDHITNINENIVIYQAAVDFHISYKDLDSFNNLDDKLIQADEELNKILENSDPDKIILAIRSLKDHFQPSITGNDDLKQLNIIKSFETTNNELNHLINTLNRLNSFNQPTPYSLCLGRNPGFGVSCTLNPRWDL